MQPLLKKLLIISIYLVLNFNISIINAVSTSSKAESILETMTLEEKVGQMFLVKYEGFNPLSLANNYHLSGFIWYGKDFMFKTPNMVKNEISNLQANVVIPLFIAVDEEGGTVNRISSYFQFRKEPFLTARDYFFQGGWDLVKKSEEEKIKLLSDLGLNLNFGLVVDIPHSSSDYIYSRSFSTHADEVSLLVENIISIYKETNVGNVLKHFPGYGNNSDTHKGVAYDNRSLEELMSLDFLPFETGVKMEANAIMVSHNIMMQIDENMPASLSKKVINLLRSEMNYNGLIITDDLAMSGLSDFIESEEAAILAIEAGNDLLISSHFKNQIPAVLAAIKDGRIREERINESVLRIIESKLELNIIK